MEFSVVEMGYDRGQVDSCLADLAERLARMVAQADVAAGTNEELAGVRVAAAQLRDFLADARSDSHLPSHRMQRLIASAEEEAAGILLRARAELTAAREEARQLRDRVYAEAMQARRDFEAALHARRMRAHQVDEILRTVQVVTVPADQAPAEDGPAGAAPGQPQPDPSWVPDRSTAQV
ncbi:ATPase [Solwaraspora sp. WMMD1047]|uniref:ATPase n=1 Tax=Solwaraspora sp. WMMD1047 TaxID=3016102 RepID=UPI002416CDF2|nr:ATPase [Solwaraspora sp. WMMD1047]MDG4831292.1 ATPase [Solwaraspora sp. WMMD1047]